MTSAEAAVQGHVAKREAPQVDYGCETAEKMRSTEVDVGSFKQELLNRLRSSTAVKMLTLNLPTTTIVAQPFNVIKWQLKFNPVA